MQGGRVAKGVRADGLSGERRQSGGRHRYVAFEDRPDAEAGDAFAVGVQEQWRVWLVAVCPLTEIATECVRGLLPQRADPLLRPLPRMRTWLGVSRRRSLMFSCTTSVARAPVL